MPGECATTALVAVTDSTRVHEAASQSLEGRSPPNQDRAFAQAVRGGRAVFGVADGVGGLERGEVASEIAITCLQRFARSLEDGGPHPNLEMELCALYAEIGSAIKAQPFAGSMATTLSCGVAYEDRFVIANVGDTRTYHFNGSALRQITRDHSLLAEKLRAGETVDLGTPQAKQWGRSLTRALGGSRLPDVDVFHGELRASGEALLVLSDGVHGSVSEAQIAQTLKAARSPEQAAEHLTRLAVEQRSTDNCSAAIVCVGGWEGGQGKLPQAGTEPSKWQLPRLGALSRPQMLTAGLTAIFIVLVIIAVALSAGRTGRMAPQNPERDPTVKKLPREWEFRQAGKAVRQRLVLTGVARWWDQRPPRFYYRLYDVRQDWILVRVQDKDDLPELGRMYEVTGSFATLNGELGIDRETGKPVFREDSRSPL